MPWKIMMQTRVRLRFFQSRSFAIQFERAVAHADASPFSARFTVPVCVLVDTWVSRNKLPTSRRELGFGALAGKLFAVSGNLPSQPDISPASGLTEKVEQLDASAGV